MNNEFNVLDSSDLSFLEKQLKLATEQSISENIQISYQQLQLAANNFLKAYDILIKNEDNFNRQYLKNLINNPESSSYIKGLRGGKAAYFMRAKYLLAFDFDDKLNKFLEELPKSVLYVYDDGQGGASTYEMSMIEMAKRASAEGRLNVSKNQLTAESRQSLEESNELINSLHIQKAQSAYSGAISRLNQFYKKAGYNQKQGGLLMWKQNKEWVISRVSNAGDLKEAYVSALMTQHKSNLDKLVNDTMGAPAYYDDELIADFFHSYIANVTNKPAIIEEDIITDYMQYGVKSSKAQMPSLQQYINVATMIKNKTNFFTKEEIRADIEKEYSQNTSRNKIIGTISNLTSKTYQDLLSNLDDYTVVINI